MQTPPALPEEGGTDPKKRQAYDFTRQTGTFGDDFNADQFKQGFNFNDFGFNAEDIFGSFFGGGSCKQQKYSDSIPRIPHLAVTLRAFFYSLYISTIRASSHVVLIKDQACGAIFTHHRLSARRASDGGSKATPVEKHHSLLAPLSMAASGMLGRQYDFWRAGL